MKKIFIMFLLFLTINLFCLLSYSSVEKIDNSQTKLFNQYYAEAEKLLRPYVILQDVKSEDAATPKAKKDIERSIELYSQATKINPECWACYWFTAKAYQVLKQTDKSYEAFKTAYSIKPDNPDVANEYMMMAVEMGKLEDGLKVAAEAVKKSPKHVALMSNYALLLLLNGQVDEALVVAKNALNLNPKDLVTASVVRLINDVKSGKRPCPKSLDEL